MEQLRATIDDWLCFDQYHISFAKWVEETSVKCRKWIFSDYIEDDRLERYLPRHPDYEKVKHRDVRFFDVNKPFTLDPFVVDEPTGTRLDSHEFTVFTAISLAVGLGCDSIHMRGLSFGGSHFDDNQNDPKIDRVYCQQASYFKKYMLPLLKARGIPIVNETKNAQYFFDGWELVER